MFWFINRWVDKQYVVYIYNGIFSLKKKVNSDTCYIMDDPWRYYMKWNKPVTKGQILYDSTCMKNSQIHKDSKKSCWWSTISSLLEYDHTHFKGPRILQSHQISGLQEEKWEAILMGTAFQFCKMKSLEMIVGHGCTTWMHLLPLKGTLKMVYVYFTITKFFIKCTVTLHSKKKVF